MWKQIKNISIIIECVFDMWFFKLWVCNNIPRCVFLFRFCGAKWLLLWCVFTTKCVNCNLISFQVFNHDCVSSAFFVRIYVKWKSQLEFYRLNFFKGCVHQWSCALENSDIHQNTSTVFILMIHISVKFFLRFQETSFYYVWNIIWINDVHSIHQHEYCSTVKVIYKSR